jgi:hypothetical protein
VPHGRPELASKGEVRCYTSVVPHGRPGTHLYKEAGSEVCGRGAICCLQISFSNQVRSGYSHGCRSSWELLKIALAGGAYLEVSWAHSHMEALELMPVGVSPWATTGAGPCISSQVVPSTQ